jgi:hypothetical protein
MQFSVCQWSNIQICHDQIYFELNGIYQITGIAFREKLIVKICYPKTEILFCWNFRLSKEITLILTVWILEADKAI